MAISNFDLDATGNVITMPLTGWTTAPVADMALIARLEYYPSASAMAQQTPEAVQLVLTPGQCREFGELLLRMADHLSQRPSGVPS